MSETQMRLLLFDVFVPGGVMGMSFAVYHEMMHDIVLRMHEEASE